MVRSTLCLPCLAVELRCRLWFQRPLSGTDPASCKPLRKAEKFCIWSSGFGFPRAGSGASRHAGGTLEACSLIVPGESVCAFGLNDNNCVRNGGRRSVCQQRSELFRSLISSRVPRRMWFKDVLLPIPGRHVRLLAIPMNDALAPRSWNIGTFLVSLWPIPTPEAPASGRLPRSGRTSRGPCSKCCDSCFLCFLI